MTANDDLDRIDQAALELAMEMARQEPGRDEQLDSMLEDRPWVDVAAFAAGCCQSRTLGLKPWEIPPCWVVDPDNADNTPHELKEHDGRRQAAKLRRQMRKFGISQWHPDPLAAIEAAKTGSWHRLGPMFHKEPRF